MSALAAIAIFPVLVLLLVALTRAENMIGGLVEEPVRAAVTPLRIVNDAMTDAVVGALNDAPTGDALPVPHPHLRLVETDERAAA